MTDVVIVGDGPAGLSAALFLAKNGRSVIVLGTDQTPMHKAKLYNYLGIESITGSELVRIGREQAASFGATIQTAEVTAAEKTGTGFAVTTADSDRHEGKYLILATGTQRDLARTMGLDVDHDGGVNADRNGRTRIPNLYVVGWSVRTMKIEAVISAGDGAAAALDILSAEAGKDVHDFDVVE